MVARLPGRPETSEQELYSLHIEMNLNVCNFFSKKKNYNLPYIDCVMYEVVEIRGLFSIRYLYHFVRADNFI